jgi:hypothetical protein
MTNVANISTSKRQTTVNRFTKKQMTFEKYVIKFVVTIAFV